MKLVRLDHPRMIWLDHFFIQNWSGWTAFTWTIFSVTVQTLLLNTYWTITFMLWRIFVVKFASIGSITVLLQASKIDPLTAKYSTRFCFLNFLCTPLALVCGLWFNLFGIIVFPIFQPYPTRFQWNLSYLLYCTYSDLSCYVTLLNSILYTSG